MVAQGEVDYPVHWPDLSACLKEPGSSENQLRRWFSVLQQRRTTDSRIALSDLSGLDPRKLDLSGVNLRGGVYKTRA